MVFDVDRLKEARHKAVRYGILDSESPIIEALDMMTAGQPLWWCEEHDSPASAKTNGACVVAVLATRRNPCRIVEGWWMPTGGGE